MIIEELVIESHIYNALLDYGFLTEEAIEQEETVIFEIANIIPQKQIKTENISKISLDIYEHLLSCGFVDDLQEDELRYESLIQKIEDNI